jgi:ribonuclease HII
MKKRTPPLAPDLFNLSTDRCFDTRLVADLRFEHSARASGFFPVAGADEAGRGPLAGPVVAAAVILDWDQVPEGLNDSKQLTKARREMLFEQILSSATVSIASSSARHIDRSDIRKASLDAMRRAIAGLAITPALGLFDGRDVPQGLICPGKAIIKGDGRSLSIAAASIIAKVTRDRMMDLSDKDFPDYGFSRHAGYGTAVHKKAIESHGPCPLHRMSFRPLRQD